MLDPLYNAFGAVLAFFYAIIPNEGVAIILLTITVMLVLFPLTAKSARSMLAMQPLQPLGRAPLLHPGRRGLPDGVPAVAPEPAQHAARRQPADADDHEGAADRLRRVLAVLPGRAGPVLPGVQPLATRTTGADHA